MIRWKSIFGCSRGASAVEFALLAPVFFAMLFALVEFSRYAWVRQTLDEVAYSTARCMSVQSTCASTATQRSHAIQRAAGYGITIRAANVTPASNTTCKGYSASNSVRINVTFESPAAGLIPALPTNINSVACFPTLS